MLVVGCQRSGTTMLRQMLDAHPAVGVMPETHLLPLIWGRGRALRRHTAATFAGWLVETLPRVNTKWGQPEWRGRLAAAAERLSRRAGWAERTASPVACFNGWLEAWGGDERGMVCGEKTPSHVYFIRPWLEATPGGRVVVMHRDPRAVGCSDERRVEADRRAGRTFDWFTLAVRWASSVAVAADGAQRFGKGRVLELRYEDVVADPEAAARGLCGFLGKPFDAAMLGTPNTNSSFGGGDATREGGGAGGVERWRSLLDDASVRRIERLVGPWMRGLGYGTEGSAGSHGGLESLRLSAMVRVARRWPVAFHQLASRERYRADRLGLPRGA